MKTVVIRLPKPVEQQDILATLKQLILILAFN